MELWLGWPVPSLVPGEVITSFQGTAQRVVGRGGGGGGWAPWEIPSPEFASGEAGGFLNCHQMETSVKLFMEHAMPARLVQRSYFSEKKEQLLNYH